MNATLKGAMSGIVEQISGRNAEPQWLLGKRLEAWESFSRLEMPELKYGSNVRLDLSKLDFSEILEKTSEGNVKTERDNYENAIIKNLSQALNENEEARKHYGTIVSGSDDKFNALTSALWANGTFIYIPAGVELNEPIRLSSLVQGPAFERVLVVAGSQSKAVIVEDISSQAGKGYRGSIVEIFADSGSKVKFVSVQRIGEEFYDIGAKKASVMDGAKVDWLVVTVGGKITKIETTSYLNGPGASTQNLGMFMGSGAQQFDLYSTAVHNASNSLSDLFTKGSLSETSKSIYRGLVYVKKSARNCDGFQREEALLLSPYARSDAIPILEIDNNDVKCTHAAAAGQVDQGKIFYMMSRGLSYKEAENQIVKGFFEGFIQKIDNKNVRKEVGRIVNEKLSK